MARLLLQLLQPSAPLPKALVFSGDGALSPDKPEEWMGDLRCVGVGASPDKPEDWMGGLRCVGVGARRYVGGWEI